MRIEGERRGKKERGREGVPRVSTSKGQSSVTDEGRTKGGGD